MNDRPRRTLVTGATGYIGRRLADRLVREPGIATRLFVRNPAKLDPELRRSAEVFEGDVLDPETLDRALEGVDVAFYLVHSMGAGSGFPDLDRRSALSFRQACVRAGVRRIVYLGGLGEKDTASVHLRSRIETGEILGAEPDKVQLLWFRAGVIIGSGSASFEIIRHLVRKLPVMVTPRFVSTRTQPIFVGDVLDYLVRSMAVREAGNLMIDIGSDILTFREMLLQTAAVMGLKRWLIPVPVFTPRLSSYWLVLMTPVPYRIAGALVNGLKSESIARNDLARTLFPGIRPLSFEEAVRRALRDVETNEVLSAWCDSSATAACDVMDKARVPEGARRDVRVFSLGGLEPGLVFGALQSVGGKAGWPSYGRLWKLRGFIDKILGGPGLVRGRRDPRSLRIGDSLDFWKVADFQEGERLLLISQMRLPGDAWLEFLLRQGQLVQTAYFVPRGTWGIFYWRLMQPFHALIFPSMGKKIIRRAKESSRQDDQRLDS